MPDPGLLTRAKNWLTGGGRSPAPTPQEPAPKPKQAKSRKPDPADLTVRADVSMVLAAWKIGAQFRENCGVTRDWVLGPAFLEGDQYLGWNDATNQVLDLMSDDQNERVRYVVHNLCLPLMEKYWALCLTSDPDVTIEPETNAQINLDAASEAESIPPHFWSENGGRAAITLEELKKATVQGFAPCLPYWAAAAITAIPRFDPDTGAEIGKVAAPEGDLRLMSLDPFSTVLEPVRRRKDARWCCVRTSESRATLREQYGEVIDGVKGRLPSDGYTGNIGDYFGHNQRTGRSWLQGWNNAEGRTGKNEIIDILIYFEKPTYSSDTYGDPDMTTPGDTKRAFPKGRMLVVAGDVDNMDGATLLTPQDEPLPQAPKQGKYGTDELPVVFLTGGEATNHPYGQSVMKHLAPLQTEYNRYLNKKARWIESLTTYAHIPMGTRIDTEVITEVKKNGFSLNQDNPNITVVVYDGTEGKATFEASARVPPDIEMERQACWADMQNIAGIHDVNLGQAPAGVSAGVSIRLLQERDNTQLVHQTRRLEQWTVDLFTCAIGIWARNVGGDIFRLMSVDQSEEQTARRVVQSFIAMNGGGAVSVRVLGGSASPKSEAGRQQQADEWNQAGIFQPANAANAKSYLEYLNTSDARKALQIITRAEQVAQQQAQAAQQQQMQDAQAMQQQQQAHELALETAKASGRNQAGQQPPQADPADQEAVKQQGEAVRQQAQQRGDAQKMVLAAHLQSVEGEQAHEQKLEQMVVQAHLQAAANPKPVAAPKQDG